MEMKNKTVALLVDSTFQCNLAFLADITDHLNALNLRLHGEKQIIIQMYDNVTSLKVKLPLWIKHLGEDSFTHNSTLNS